MLGPSSINRVGSASIAPTVTVGDVAFSDVSMQETIALILLLVQKGASAHHICTGNLDHLFLLQKHAGLRNAYRTASLVLADGMPIVWLSRLARSRKKDSPLPSPAYVPSEDHGSADLDAVIASLGEDNGKDLGKPVTMSNEAATPLRERVAGSDLFWELARVSAHCNLRIFYLGGKPGAAQEAADVVQKRYPGAQVCGVYCPPFETFNTDEEQDEIARRIREAAPDVLLVGLGAPKQETWIVDHKDRLGVPVSIGVGGSFEMAAGQVQRAPKWVQRVGMEWAFRLAQDPSRLWRRYFCNDLPFLSRLAGQMLRERFARENTPSCIVDR